MFLARLTVPGILSLLKVGLKVNQKAIVYPITFTWLLHSWTELTKLLKLLNVAIKAHSITAGVLVAAS